MKVKLRVIQGTLQNRKGDDAGVVISIRRNNFVIGSAEDANMRCMSKVISPRHCELITEGEQITVRDLESETGTFLNGDRLTDIRQLEQGDRLKVGRLEFEVAIEFSAKSDSVSRFVNELLEEGDEEARLERLRDPQQRQFEVPPSSKQPDAETEVAEDSPTETKKPLQRPPKKPPGKLPPPEPIVADNTVDAAAASLERIFQKQKP
jgi:pSer/pThr/pTyr-binding forkhead associated (FHA) protein